MKITIKNQEEIEKMRVSGRAAASVLSYIGPFIQPGVSTEKINQLGHEFMTQQGWVPATLGYHGYTKSLCTSVNDVICHGIPTNTEILQDGDIVNIDVTTIVEGYHGDTSRMYLVGTVSEKAQKLVERTKKAMEIGIGVVGPGRKFSEIGVAIEKYISPYGYAIVRDFVGHGIGTKFHEPPHVFHYKTQGGPSMKAGMTFTIEPMINASSRWDSFIEEDGWTARTVDGALSAQWEHTVLVTEEGSEVLTVDS